MTKISSRLCLAVAGLVFQCLAAAPALGTVRVAIVVDSVTRTVPQSVAVAEGLLSTNGSGVALVERQAIDQVLAEQQISAALATGEQSVALGKLLSAQVFAVVEPSSDGKSVDGLVVFDAETGVRLEDTALPADAGKAARLIAEQIKAAVAKHDLPTARKRTICLMTVRNVDLPGDLDGLCGAAGKLIERRLTESPVVTVLERSRLDKVNAERALPTADPRIKNLAATLTAVELQLSRNGTGGITLKCILTDASGKLIGAPSVTGPIDQLATLTDQASQAICQALHGKLAVAGADRHLEARRFLREMRFRWSHRQRALALQDAEAAFALVPDSSETQHALVRALLSRGADLTCALDDSNPNYVSIFPLFSDKPAEIARSLKLMNRGAEMLLVDGAAASAAPTATAEPISKAPVHAALRPATRTPQEQDREVSVQILRGYLTAMGCQITIAPTMQGFRPLNLSPAQRALFERVRTSFRRFRMEVEQPLAMAAVHDEASFDQYSGFLFELLGDSTFCLSRSEDEWTGDLSSLIPQWVKLANKYDRVPLNPFGPSRHPLYPTGRANEDPTGKLLMALSNSWLGGSADWAGISFPFDKRPMGWGNFSEHNLNQLKLVYAALATHHDRSFLQASDVGLNWVAKTRWNQARSSLPAPVRRYPQLLAAPIQLTAGIGPAAPQPAPSAASEGPGLFWKDARTLLDVIDGKHRIRMIFDPMVVDGAVYCCAFADEPRGPAIEVLKFDPLSGKCTVLGQEIGSQYAGDIQPRPGTEHDRLSERIGGCIGSIAEHNYLVRDVSGALLIFPLKGGKPTRIDALSGFPAAWMENATVLDGKVYAEIGDSLFIEYDPATHKYQTLASSQRKEHLTPFDDSPPFHLSLMISDPRHDRIVMFAGSPQWPKARGGLYEFDAKTRKIRPLLTNDKLPSAATQPVDYASQPATAVQWGGDTLVQIGYGPWSAAYDVDKEKVMPVPWAKVPLTINRKVETVWPHALQGDWIWTSLNLGQKWHARAAFGRLDTVKKRLQIFPPLRPTEISAGMWPDYLQTIDDQHMLVGDQYGLWVVTPPDGLASPANMLRDETEPVAQQSAMRPPAGGDLPWKLARTLYDLTYKPDGFDYIVHPVAHDGFIYAIGLGHTGSIDRPTQAFVRLLKFSPVDGSQTQLGLIPLERIAWPTQMMFNEDPGPHHGERTKMSFNFLNAYAFAGDHLICATVAGLFDFPLDGSPGRHIQARPALSYNLTSICFLDGYLYVSEASRSGSRLLRWNPRDNSSQPVVADSDLKKIPPFAGDGVRIPFLCADKANHRVIFVAVDKANRASSSGIWAFDPARNKFTQLRHLFLTPPGFSNPWPGRSVAFRWGKLIDGHQLLMSTSRGFCTFDLRDNSMHRIQQMYPDIDVLAPTSQPTTAPVQAAANDLLGGSIGIMPPVAMDERWIWCQFPWSRVSRDGKTWQMFPALRPGDTNFVPQQAIERFDDKNGRHLLVADGLACWVLDLNSSR